MPFRYNLQKILNFRMQKRDAQIEVVKVAEREVQRIQHEIDLKKQEIAQVQAAMKTAQYIMMESYDAYIKHLWELIEKLEIEKQEAIKKLQEEQERLLEMEKEVKVLEKHKERKKEKYLAEEKKAEMKMLDEVGSLKHFRQSQERKQDEMEDELLEELRKQEEGNFDEY